MVRNAGLGKMEPTFYEDSAYNQRFCGDSVNSLKRSMTLDLNSNNGIAVKKMKLLPAANAPVLSSPDYKKLNLNTPELEKMIMAQTPMLQTPTPSLVFVKAPTEAQEMFTRGFEDALNELHHSDSSQGAVHHVELPRSSSSSSSSGATYMTLDNPFPSSNQLQNHFGLGISQGDSVTVKEEPQTVPLGPTPPMSPIDMECQERFKLERKRERNRVAASKCRRRKLERIARLEEKVKILKGEEAVKCNLRNVYCTFAVDDSI